MFGRNNTSCRMPFAASSGRSLPFGERLLDEFRREPLEEVEFAVDERQPLACPSSMTVIWMRPTSGNLLPLSAAAIGIDSGGTGPAGT